MFKQSEKEFPWLTRNVINKSFKKYCMNMNYKLSISTIKTKQMEANLLETERKTVANILTEFTSQPVLAIPSSNQLKGGRLKESTYQRKKFVTLENTTFINEVAVKFSEEKKESSTFNEEKSF